MVSEKKLLSLITNRYLELIILPTEQCNFRCVYCYEDFAIGKMKPAIVEGIKKFISQRVKELDVLKLSWFGGEPLAAKNIVLELSEFVQSLTAKYSHLQYCAGITTNAFLLKPDLFENLVRLGITNYQISLDGTAKMHDQSRKRMNGGATFAVIWRHLLAMKQSNLTFTIIIRLHLTPTNLDDMVKLVDLLKIEFEGDQRFTLFFKAIENLGGPHSGSFEVLHGENKANLLQRFNQQSNGKLSVNTLENDGPYVCYAARTNSFVIRANGKIGKCTVALQDDRNALGQIESDGTISVDHAKLALWTRGIKSLDLRDLHCPAEKLPKLTSFNNIPIIVNS